MTRLSSLARTFVFTMIAVIVAAISFNGLYQRWGFFDDDIRCGIDKVLDGTAIRPWAYRHMIPDIANAIDAALTPDVHEQVAAALALGVRQRMPLSLPKAAAPEYIIRYHIVYAATLLAGLLAIASVSMFVRARGATDAVGFMTGASLVLLMPLLQKGGGYYYDMPELAFFCLFLTLCSSPRALWLTIPIAALATWNKESFLLFMPCGFPFMSRVAGRAKTMGALGLGMALAAGVYEIQRLRFDAVGGGSVEFHLYEQLEYIRSPSLLLANDPVYGVPVLSGSVPLTVLAMAVVLISAWKTLDVDARRSFQIALAINVPLFLALCGPGEIRNLSMLLPGVAMAIAICLDRLLRGDAAKGEPPPAA